MIKKSFLKIRPTYLFNTLALILIVLFVSLSTIYQNTREEIALVNHKANIDYVSSLSRTLSLDIQRILEKDYYKSLEDDFIAREYIESNLKLFVTKKYQNIYLVAKESRGRLVYLTQQKFNNTYEPINKKFYDEVYRTQKALYFKDKKELLASYLSPIVINNRVEALIVIKFSLQEKNTIFLALEELNDLFVLFVGFFILIFIFIIWLSYVDKKREDTKDIVFEKLQESNTNLHNLTVELKIKSDKISEMNENLEERVEAEVSKNRVKDAQLIHQARLAQMGEMISMIAHQWRQPLTAISAASASLNLKAQLDKLNRENVQEMTEDISEYALHLSQTIDDFRNFFKPNKNKVFTNYNEIIASVKKIIEVSLLNKQIKMISELENGENFETYPNELKQVVLNLIKNAEDALIESQTHKPYIKLVTYTQEENFILEVSDNAGGIAEDIIEKIFDPYFSTKLEKDGTGLGLYMSKMIVEEHCHGRLEVQNTESGALFRLTLGKR